MTLVSLPGLDRLIAVCQRHSVAIELPSPVVSAPKAGEHVLGEPFDSQLAAVYQRIGAGVFGPVSLLPPGSGLMNLIPWNQRLREDTSAVHFHSCHVFGQQTGFSLYFGTVPRLADTRGHQPVVYIPAHSGEQFAIPIASSVDRFFDLYSRYVERMVVDFEYIHTGLPELVFPWSIPELVATDAPLIAQVRAGRFDLLMNNEEGAHEWIRALLSPSSSS